MELSKRLAAVAGMVTKGNVVCDVGCDHGYVSIYLVQAGIAPRVIAMDVRSGPLSQAKGHISMYGLSEYIETRLSDGVDTLQIGEADTLILAGMGGRLMEGILTRGREKIFAMKELILQPQSEIAAFRKFLRKAGLKIVAEDMVYEEGKFYPMMRVIPKIQELPWVQGACEEADAQKEMPGKVPGEVFREIQDQSQALGDLYGEFLLKEKHPVLWQYLSYQNDKLTQLLQALRKVSGASGKNKGRLEEIKQELWLNQAARERYEE